MTGELLLDVLGLRVWFHQYDRGLRRRTVTAVESMDLTVAAGEVVALVGASGAGKSLLAHGVLGLLPANGEVAGTVRWRGQALSPEQRTALAGREIALLPQTLSALDPTATVRSQLRAAARVLGRPAGEVGAALRRVGLEERVERLYPHQLSGGMARRVLTAIALLGDPALVIADEPTPGLAAGDVTEVLTRLRGMADEGRGVLLITHDITAALEVADRVVVCQAGRTVEDVSAAQWAAGELADPYSQALWRALPSNGFALEEAPC